MGDKPGIIHRKWFQALMVVVILLALGSAFGDDGEDAGSSVAGNQTSLLEEPASLQEAITAVLDGNTNYGLPRLQDLQVEDKADGVVVWVYFNGDENLTVNLTRKGIEYDMADLYRAIYTFPGVKVRAANLLASSPLVDQFGNESQDVVYSTSMKAAIADQVNWDSDLVDFTQLWTTWVLHPAIQE